MNKYLKVSLTLATIASGSALLIGLMNLATANTIKANKDNKIKNGISSLCPGYYISKQITFVDTKEGEYGYKPEYDGNKYPHLKNAYHCEIRPELRITVPDEDEDKYVYSTTGKNAYGQVDLLILIGNGEVEKMFVVTNTESYGPTLEDNYINKYNNGYLTDLADVSCGATYGAKLVKEECDDAIAHWTEFYKEAK